MFGSSSLDLFGSSSKATTGGDSVAGVGGDANATDVECPSVDVRTGAATLLIGSKPGESEPSALDVRYQGSIIRTARECHVNAGVMTMKVGVEGRVITGPAGGPGTVEVPLRLAVVHEGINPKAIVSKLARIPVTIAGAVDRVTFTHIDSDISFPLPTAAGRYRLLRGLCRLRSGRRDAGEKTAGEEETGRQAERRVAKPKQS